MKRVDLSSIRKLRRPSTPGGIGCGAGCFGGVCGGGCTGIGCWAME